MIKIGEAQLSPASQAQPSAAARALRILVVDDDRDTVLTLMMLLRDEGHDVRGLHSGQHVLDTMRDFDPDVVLLDIALPALSGWEVARTIRERLGRRPVLVGISGEYRHGVDRILSEVVGFDHYLVKPYETSSLLAILAPLRLPPADQ